MRREEMTLLPSRGAGGEEKEISVYTFDSRCNTWPRRGLGEGVGVKEEGLPLVCEEEGRGEDAEEGEQREAIYLPTPKSNARRNPWGNFSYADLITQVVNMEYLDLSGF